MIFKALFAAVTSNGIPSLWLHGIHDGRSYHNIIGSKTKDITLERRVVFRYAFSIFG
jgi:hypothetical protein